MNIGFFLSCFITLLNQIFTAVTTKVDNLTDSWSFILNKTRVSLSQNRPFTKAYGEAVSIMDKNMH